MRSAASKIHCSIAYLDSVRENALRLDEEARALARAEEVIGVRGIAYSGEPGTAGGNGNVVEYNIARYLGSKEEYEKGIRLYASELRNANRLIGRLGVQKHRMVLKRHYLWCDDMDEIAADMGYSKRQVYRYRDAACLELYEHLSEHWKDKVPKAI